MKLSTDDLDDFVRGAAFMGTGGGGDPYIGKLLLMQEMASGRPLSIIGLDDLQDDALVAPVAAMGAPTVMVERFPKIESMERAISSLEEFLGRKLDALLAAEVGGVNATLPLIAAARTGLPVVDADGMGRAFPELQMVTFNIYGCSASPIVMVDDYGDRVIIDTSNNLKAEHYARAVVMAMRGEAQIALYPMSGADAKRTAIPDTMSMALEVGRAIGKARRNKSDPVEGLLTHLRNIENARYCQLIFHGKIVDLIRETRKGFAVGRAIIQGMGDDGRTCEVEFQNENLVAKIDGKIAAMVPDLVCIVDSETAEPVTTEALKYGHQVKVLGVSVPPIMRTKAALDVFGPRAFGIDVDYVPIENLV